VINIEEYIDGSKFELISDLSFGDKFTTEHPLEINKLIKFISSFKENRMPIIYVDSDRVLIFFEILRNNPTKDFILISHNGDTIFNDKDISNKPECIKKWYGQNINVKNTENIISLPIGLERPHWSKERYGVMGFKHNKIYEYSNLNFEKNKFCYINFSIDTNIHKRGWIPAYFKDSKNFHIRLGGINGNIDDYLKECKESHYVLCPDGNGIDCHRNWEMLYIGVTPIIEHSEFHKEIYDDLPVVIVNSFKEIDESLILKNKELLNTNYNINKLKFSYWENLIKS
jgi:hypothetical protein